MPNDNTKTAGAVHSWLKFLPEVMSVKSQSTVFDECLEWIARSRVVTLVSTLPSRVRCWDDPLIDNGQLQELESVIE